MRSSLFYRGLVCAARARPAFFSGLRLGCRHLLSYLEHQRRDRLGRVRLHEDVGREGPERNRVLDRVLVNPHDRGVRGGTHFSRDIWHVRVDDQDRVGVANVVCLERRRRRQWVRAREAEPDPFTDHRSADQLGKLRHVRDDFRVPARLPGDDQGMAGGGQDRRRLCERLRVRLRSDRACVARGRRDDRRLHRRH